MSANLFYFKTEKRGSENIMIKNIIYQRIILFLILNALFLIFQFSGCTNKLPDYADNINIKVSLGYQSDLSDLNKNDIFYN